MWKYGLVFGVFLPLAVLVGLHYAYRAYRRLPTTMARSVEREHERTLAMNEVLDVSPAGETLEDRKRRYFQSAEYLRWLDVRARQARGVPVSKKEVEQVSAGLAKLRHDCGLDNGQ